MYKVILRKREYMFNATVTKEGTVNVIYLVGKLNIATADDFINTLKGLVTTDSNEIVLEMSELTYITSDGLKTLLVWLEATSQVTGKKRLAVCNLQQFVKLIFEYSGFDKKFPVFDSLNEALNG